MHPCAQLRSGAALSVPLCLNGRCRKPRQALRHPDMHSPRVVLAVIVLVLEVQISALPTVQRACPGLDWQHLYLYPGPAKDLSFDCRTTRSGICSLTAFSLCSAASAAAARGSLGMLCSLLVPPSVCPADLVEELMFRIGRRTVLSPVE